MTTMDHADATLTGAAERYVIGDMEEQERERYEAHFFSCADCADEVRAAARFVENARPLLHTVPDPAVSVWRAPARVTGPSWWDALVASFRVPLGAAAAGLVLVGIVAYQSLIVMPTLRHDLRQAESLQTAPSYFLSVARGPAPVIALSSGERAVTLTLSRSFDRTFPFYRVDVQDAHSRSIQSSVVRPVGTDQELPLLLKVSDLPSGPYVVVVTGMESESSQTPASDTARYPFTLDRRETAR